MNTLSIPTPTSPEATFRQGAASPHAAPQGEASLSDREARLWTEVRILAFLFPVVTMLATAGSILAPRLMAAALGIAISAVAIVTIYCWATHRGDTEIGVSDTQGRDTTNPNSDTSLQ